jgi:hypothetical protein
MSLRFGAWQRASLSGTYVWRREPLTIGIPLGRTGGGGGAIPRELGEIVEGGR